MDSNLDQDFSSEKEPAMGMGGGAGENNSIDISFGGKAITEDADSDEKPNVDSGFGSNSETSSSFGAEGEVNEGNKVGFGADFTEKNEAVSGSSYDSNFSQNDDPSLQGAARASQFGGQDFGNTESQQVTFSSQTVPPVAKKSKKGLIAALIVALVLILGAAAAAVWYFVVYSNPDNAVAEAVANMINAEHVVINNGRLSVEAISTPFTISGSEASAKVDMTINSQSRDLPSQSKIDAKVEISNSSQNEDSSLNGEISVENVFTEDGVLYLKIDKLGSTLNSVLQSISENSKVQFEQILKQWILPVVEEVDGQWYRIDIDQVLKYANLNSEDLETRIRESYQCILEQEKNVKDTISKVVELYKKNPFLHAEKYSGLDYTAGSGNTIYRIKVDDAKLAAFLNDVKSSSLLDGYYTCIAKVSDAVSIDSIKESVNSVEIKKEDVSELTSQLGNIAVEVSDFGHKMTRFMIWGMASDSDSKSESLAGIKMELPFDYPKEYKVNVPEEYKPMSDFVDGLITKIDGIDIQGFGVVQEGAIVTQESTMVTQEDISAGMEKEDNCSPEMNCSEVVKE